MNAAIPFDDSSAGSRGVLASYGTVTPAKTEGFKITLGGFTLRDALWLLGGCIAMIVAQVVAQSGIRSDIRDIGTKFELSQQRQQSTNLELQRQLEDARRMANLALVNDADTAKALAELRGFLAGSGIKGVAK